MTMVRLFKAIQIPLVKLTYLHDIYSHSILLLRKVKLNASPQPHLHF
jgi:hypothetical protein